MRVVKAYRWHLRPEIGVDRKMEEVVVVPGLENVPTSERLANAIDTGSYDDGDKEFSMSTLEVSRKRREVVVVVESVEADRAVDDGPLRSG